MSAPLLDACDCGDLMGTGSQTTPQEPLEPLWFVPEVWWAEYERAEQYERQEVAW